ncbi:MAG: hypothetical protein GTN99_01585, partial [Candidatus Dadabacteria bacterium]|nr:hypothetical protein [Candidatus Dadabacteria bacterium]
EVQGICRPVVYGNEQILKKAKDLVAIDAAYKVESCGNFSLDNHDPGMVSAESG